MYLLSVEIFISPHGFKLPSSFLSFHPEEVLLAFLEGQVPHLAFILKCLNFSLNFEGQLCQIENSQLTGFIFLSSR